MLGLLVLLQVAVHPYVARSLVEGNRVNYDVARNNMTVAMRRAVDHMESELRSDPATDYVVLLGDSIGYGFPGTSKQTIGYYLEQWGTEHGHPVRVFNFSQPGMQPGDYYTVLLMLQERGIPLRKVLVNLIYFGFVERTPKEPVVSWLGYELQRLDPTTFDGVKSNLGGRFPPKPWTNRLRELLLGRFALWEDRDLIRSDIALRLHWTTTPDVMDRRVWTAKPWLYDLMREPLYQRFFDPKPFDMTTRNPQILMLSKLIEQLRGTTPLFFFTPVNHAFLQQWVSQPGYHENVRRIDAWFANRPVQYVNMETAMPPELFIDHVHLLPEGYQRLAAMLAEHLFTVR